MYKFDGDCFDLMQTDILDLINRQKMKVCELEDRLDWAEADYNAVDIERIKAEEEELEKAKAEIKKLNTVNADMHESLRLACETNKDLGKLIDTAEEKINILHTECSKFTDKEFKKLEKTIKI